MSQSAGFTFVRQHREDRRQARRSAPDGTAESANPTIAIPASLPNEVFTNICHQILPPDPTGLPRKEVIQRRRTLRNLALACTGGHREVALDTLWSCLDSLEPVIKLLPNIDLQHSYFYGGGESFHNASVFRRYAARVRILDLISRKCRLPGYEGVLEEEYRPTISPQVFVLLTRELAGQPLLPRLQKITLQCGVLHVEPQYELAALSALYSPSVETVTLLKGVHFSATYYSRFLPLAMQQFPSVKHLTVESKDQAGGRAYPLLLKISEMTSLESLDLRLPGSGLDLAPMLDLLRKLNRLTSITLDVHFDFHQTDRRDFRCRAANLGLSLENLKSVHLYNRADDSLCQCIPDALLERVTHLTVIAKHDAAIGAPTGLFSSDFVERLSRIPTLKRLDLEGGTMATTDGLSPVVRQLGLAELNIHLDRGTQPNTSAMVELARSRESPTLKTLRIGRRDRDVGHADTGVDQVTALQHIAEDAKPGLEHLALELLPSSSNAAWEGLSARQTPGVFASKWLNALRRYSFVSKSTLRTLALRVVGWTASPSLQQTRDLAHILDTIFPHLEEIRPFADNEYEAAYWVEEWSHIEELRKYYRRDRLTEDR